MNSAVIEDVTEFVLDGTHGSPSRTETGVPVLSAQNVKDGTLDYETDRYTSATEHAAFAQRLPLRAGDVLLTIVGTIGRAAVLDDVRPLVFQRSVAVLRPREEVLCPRFLYHVSQSQAFQSQLSRASNQSSQAGVYLGKLKKLRIPLPPLPQQRRIAEILDKADSLRAKRRAALAKLDTLTQSIFLDMFGDPATNPKGWRIVSVGDICEVKGGKRLPRGEEYSSVPTPFRYIRVVDLKGGYVDESELVYLKPEVQAEIARYVVHTGDVIISIAGSIGLVAAVPESLNGVNLTENAAKLVPRTAGLYEADYLAKYLRTEYAQGQIGSHVGQVTIGKLALFRIEKLKVPLPPCDLQREFIQRIAAVNKNASVQLEARSQLDALFGSVQYRAFHGGL